MNLNQLVHFYAVGKTGNYSRAAQELDVSQPAIYKSVRSLERACGLKLLERQGKGVSLTKGGRVLFEYAAQIASLNDAAQQAIAEESGPMSGHISIGTGTRIGGYLLPDILGRWISEHPYVTLSIIQGQHQRLRELLLQDRLDFLLSADSQRSAGLVTQVIFSDSLVVVSRAGHPLERLSIIPLRLLAKEPFIAPLTGSPTREELDQIQSQYGVGLRIAVEVNWHFMIKQLCLAGVGIGAVPKSIVMREIENKELSVLNVEGFPRGRRYFLVRRAGKVLTAEMRSLLAAVEFWGQEENRRVS